MVALPRTQPALRLWLLALAYVLAGAFVAWKALLFMKPDMSTPGVDGIVVFTDTPDQDADVTVGIDSTGTLSLTVAPQTPARPDGYQFAMLLSGRARVKFESRELARFKEQGGEVITQPALEGACDQWLAVCGRNPSPFVDREAQLVVFPFVEIADVGVPSRAVVATIAIHGRSYGRNVGGSLTTQVFRTPLLSVAPRAGPASDDVDGPSEFLIAGRRWYGPRSHRMRVVLTPRSDAELAYSSPPVMPSVGESPDEPFSIAFEASEADTELSGVARFVLAAAEQRVQWYLVLSGLAIGIGASLAANAISSGGDKLAVQPATLIQRRLADDPPAPPVPRGSAMLVTFCVGYAAGKLRRRRR